jgi:hypothetical protein
MGHCSVGSAGRDIAAILAIANYRGRCAYAFLAFSLAAL